MKKSDSKKSYSNFKGTTSRTSSRAPSPKPYSKVAFFEKKSNKIERTQPEKSSPRLDQTTRGTQALSSKPSYVAHTSKLFTPRPTDFKKSPSSSPYKKDAYKKTTETKSLKSKVYSPKSTSDTSWGTVASWYNDHLEKTGDTYHEKVVYPNLLRVIGDIKGKKVLDLACGQGQFSRLMRDKGAHVTGVDLGKELIAIAESHNISVKEAKTHKAIYLQGSADDLYMLKDSTFDIVVCILALQNIENLQKTIEEAKRVLAPNGSFVFVLNHPSFRNPRQTYWGYDEEHDTQFRRVDEYMSESHYKIDMTPGSKTDKKFTVSFHRPLQVYVKALSKARLSLTHLEEWVSHKESEKGPRQKAENKSRKEVPLFMCIEGKKNNH
jgi:ubiquinone/menaquinone biosynthesis C-methylase UbiE